MTLETRLEKGYLALYVLITITILIASYSMERGNSCVDNGAGAGPMPSLLDSGSGQETQSALPQDSFQRCATRALRGDFGDLAPWQKKGYELLLETKPTEKLAWITHYWVGEPGVNHTTASGRRVSNEVCAMLDLKFGTFVLIDLPKGFNLRRVWDRGSRRNAGRARAAGASVWCDLWVPRPTKKTYIRNIYIVP